MLGRTRLQDSANEHRTIEQAVPDRQRQADGLPRRRNRRRGRVPARQPDIVVSLARHRAARIRPGPLRRARPDRPGRFGQARRLRAPTRTPSSSTASTSTACSTSSISATTSRSSSTTGVRRSASTGPTATATASPASATWKRSSARSRGTSGPKRRVGIFQAMRSEAGEEMVLTKNLFVEAILPCLDHPQAQRRGDERVPPPVRQTRARTAGRRSRGHARSRSTASRPTWSRSCSRTPTGCRPPRCRSCSSTPSRARSSPAPNASSARTWPNQTEIDRRRHPLHPGRQRRRDRRSDLQLVEIPS